MEAVQLPDMVFCRAACGKQMHRSAIACPGCGATQVQSAASATDKRILPAAVLCFFLGWLGVHRFYVGKIGTGILQMLSFGGFGIWMLVDFIVIVVGSFTDKAGNRVTLWT